VAMSAALRLYTVSSTQTVSTSARWDTHAPASTNRSAPATCAASSLVISRTRTIEPHLERVAERWSTRVNHGGLWPKKEPTKHSVQFVTAEQGVRLEMLDWAAQAGQSYCAQLRYTKTFLSQLEEN
jgi:hypothetical protein